MGEVQEDSRVSAAARWLSEQTVAPPNPITAIRQKFSLTALQSCEVCKLAQEIRSGRGKLNG
ncbi:hypothetical protein [Neorhizobium sp. LjRoot104]|uniref:hypothetical protein n=1 Tax=Neorhizobium sp. LjRoot104 TaxID=3342254 RepID=UPI003ED0E784